MQTPIQITVRDMDHSPALDQHIRDKETKLEQYFSLITSCRVVAGAPHRHHHRGKLYTVRLDIAVPGREIVVNHEHDEDVYVALRDTFAAAGRRTRAGAWSRQTWSGKSSSCRRVLSWPN